MDSVIATIQALDLAKEGWRKIEGGDFSDEEIRANLNTIGQLSDRELDDEVPDFSIFNNYTEAVDALSEGYYGEVTEFFEDIETLGLELVEDIEITTLEDGKGEQLGEGLNDAVYEYGEGKVLRVSDHEIESSADVAKSKLSKLKFDQVPDEISIPTVHSLGTHNGFKSTVEERAPGDPLHEYDESYEDWSERVQTLARASQEQYNELIEQAQKLEEYGLTVDVSKADNIFYDTEEGFTFVDIHDGGTPDLSSNPSSFVTLATAINYPEQADWTITEEDLDNLCRIHHKLRKAGDPYEDDFERRMARKAYPNADIPEELKPPKPEPITDLDLNVETYINTIEGQDYDDIDMDI